MASFIEKGGFLEHCLDGIHLLSPEVNREFALLGDLDKRVEDMLASIKDKEEAFARDGPSLTKEERKQRLAEIEAMFREAKALSEDKVSVSIQSYELVDKHIRKLDKELADFESDVIAKCGSLAAFVGANDSDPAPDASEPPGGDGLARRKGKLTGKELAKKKKAAKLAPVFLIGKNKKKAGKKAGEEPSESPSVESTPPTPVRGEAQVPGMAAIGSSPMSLLRSLTNDGLDMPVDPNEPTYCVCNQVSFGQMVGCENPECPVEWFHFPCVGLTSKPKGSWWCPSCAPKFDPNYKPPVVEVPQP